MIGSIAIAVFLAAGNNTGFSLSAEWVSAYGTVGAAISTTLAVLIVLFRPLLKRPSLSIVLQRPEGLVIAYWHESSMLQPLPGGIANSIMMKQLRIWVANGGREVARNCRVKLRVVEPGLDGRDAPIEFTLPVFLYYRPVLTDGGFMKAPEPNQVSVDIAAHSREAFELLFHRTGMQACYPYSLTTFPLEPNKKYLLNLRAYADGASPSKEVTYGFFWNGTEVNLSAAVLSEGMHSW